MRNQAIWQYFAGDNVMFTIGEEKYVGTLKRDHNKFHQALLLVGIFNLNNLLFNNVLEIDKKKAKMEKNAKRYRFSNCLLYRMSRRLRLTDLVLLMYPIKR